MTHPTYTLPGLMSRPEAELRQNFLHQIEVIPMGERIKRCIQCGTCTGSCPVSYAMDLPPRELIALFRAGEIETIMKSRSIWMCASCYSCTTRCPAGIRITDIVYALKRTAMEKAYDAKAHRVQILASLFINNLMRYGRLHEGTLIRRFYMKTGVMKLFGFIPLVLKMHRTKRLALFPKRIRAHASLSRIIDKAQEIELRSAPPPPAYLSDFVGYRGLGEMKLETRKGD
ncbi:MAG TPA: 4Fe-4S dicluster domain-containing protein [Bacteroidota bacterium]|nr:4Fe-4S dicluster domain-containing protein [Bacteroidota bacterium]